MEQPNISYIQSMSGGDKNFEKKLPLLVITFQILDK